MAKSPKNSVLIQQQGKKTKFIAKLKATLNPSSQIQRNATANVAAKAVAAKADAAKHTESAATAAYPKIQKINKKSSSHSTTAESGMNFQSRKKMKSGEPIRKFPKMTPKVAVNAEVTPKAKPKEASKDKAKVTFNANTNRTTSRKGQCQPVEVNKTKTIKKKEPMPRATVSTEPKSHKHQTNQDGGKRKFEQSKPNQTKRLKKNQTGFTETNIDSPVNIAEKPKKVKKKPLHAKQLDDTGPSVKVISVDGSQLNGSSGHSDSEADSYIDKFFQDDNNEFDENRLYSADEIEMKNGNFLAKASGERAQSDDTSSEDFQVHDANSDDGKLTVLKTNNRKFTNILEKYSSADEDDSCDDGDYDSENGDMFYGSDSDVSLGSVVDSDDLDDTYECESTDESADGYEMHSSYDEDEDEDDDHSECDESDCSDYSDSESQSSSDTYDEFLNSRHYESSNDDQDYNSKCFK